MTRFYINTNKTLVSNGQIKIRVDESTQSTTTTTTTAAPTTTTTAAPVVVGYVTSNDNFSGTNPWTSSVGTYCPAGTFDGVSYYINNNGYPGGWVMFRQDAYWYVSYGNVPGTEQFVVAPHIFISSNSSTPPLSGWAKPGGGDWEDGTLTQTTCGEATTTTTTTTTAAPTTTTTTTAAPASFTPMAVLLTSGTSYTVPAGATSMKAWAVGGGGGLSGGAGGTAFNTWGVSGGSTVTYNIGAAGVSTNNNSTNGGDTTATYNGTTITGMGGKRSYGGPDQGQGGGWTSNGGGAVGGSVTSPPGDPYVSIGGAVGGNSSPVLICAGYSQAGRRPATNVSSLLEAVALAGGVATQACGSTAAFGSGANGGEKYSPAAQDAGLGGGGSGGGLAGGGALILYFTSEPFTPTPFTPMAVLLTSGTSYTVPGGATSMKAWAVGGGGTLWNYPAGAGGTAFKTWSVMGGNTLTYAVGAQGDFGLGANNSGRNTTITFSGTTITGNGGGGGTSNYGTGGSYSGGDGGATGGSGTGGNGVTVGGAVGGNSQSILMCPGYQVNGRRPATNVSGLLEAVALAGGVATQACGSTPAFGSGGTYGEKFADALQAGLGGGGSGGYLGGNGAVVLYFT